MDFLEDWWPLLAVFLSWIALGTGVFVYARVNKLPRGGLQVRACPACQAPAPPTRRPHDLQEAFWGGWTCATCLNTIDARGNASSKGRPASTVRPYSEWDHFLVAQRGGLLFAILLWLAYVVLSMAGLSGFHGILKIVIGVPVCLAGGFAWATFMYFALGLFRRLGHRLR